jgi:methanogenic corrinoid protein MtbC1
MDLMSRPAYPIRAVARITGLSPDTLRAWERRYQVVAPRRGDRGRLYGDGDVERLKQLARLVDAGHAIGAIAGLSTPALARLGGTAAPRPAPPGLGIDLGPLLQAMKQYDLPAVDALLSRHAALLPVDEFIFSVVVPALRQTGARWEAGSVRPAQEHLIAASLRSILGALLRTAPPAPTAATTMVFATLPGERHELGLLSAAVLAAHRGRRAIYLGADVPARDLVHAANALDAAAVVVAATMPQITPVRELRALRKLRDGTAVLAGGSQRLAVRRELGARVRPLETLADFATVAERPPA